MDNQDQPSAPSLGFAQRQLPWLVAAGALVLYLVTLNHWVRLESLPSVARAAGWEWAPQRNAPWFFLLTLPFRLLPGAIQPLVLNVFTAVLAAISLGFLARAVSLLPFDRTRESRQREHHELALLSLPLAWVGPLFGAALCAFGFMFWMQATAATGEMLDLLLFAYLVRCLTEYRLDRREGWLLKLALVYGAAVTNNYAMIAFFPCCLVALVWILQEDVFQVGLWLRMLVCGLVGLLSYLILPVASILTGHVAYTFGQYLQLELGFQKQALMGVPRWLVFLLALQSLAPVLMLGIRWRVAQGDTNPAGARIAAFVTRFMHVLMWAVCVSVFLDFKWGPRVLGVGFAWLPLYYLAALGAGYYTGYLLLVFHVFAGRPWERQSASGRTVSRMVVGLVLLATAAAPVCLIVRNLPAIRQSDGHDLAQLSAVMVRSLPAQPAYLVADSPTELLLAEAALRSQTGQQPHVMVYTRLLPFFAYQEELARRYPQRWTPLVKSDKLTEPIDSALLTVQMARLAATQPVYYLHPSMGYYFEAMQMVPHGAVFQLRVLPTNSVADVAIPAAALNTNQQFWTTEEPVIKAVEQVDCNASGDAFYIHQFLSRALNYWGVTLQRNSRAAEATRWFEMAKRLLPYNVAAIENLAFNTQLRGGSLPPLDLTRPLDVKQEVNWNDLLLQFGPLDSPAWTFRVGRVFIQGQLFRQAVAEFRRVLDLYPDNTTVRVWEHSAAALAWLSLGDTAGAEKQALALRDQFPTNAVALETVTQVYLNTGRLQEAEHSAEQELALNPENQRALLNLGALRIALKDYAGAIAPMDKLLTLAPRMPAALLNRAIACLQTGHLDAAERDYNDLTLLLPDNPAVYFGLGDIAFQRKDASAALRNYRQYLQLAPSNSSEFKGVLQRVKELESGGTR